MGWKVW